MSHIFFERLEQRRNTQSLSFGTSGFFDYGSSFGGISTPSSSFSSGYTPFGSSSVTMGYKPDWLQIDTGPTCYYWGSPIILPEPIWTQPIPGDWWIPPILGDKKIKLPGDGPIKFPSDWVIWSPSKFPPIYDPSPGTTCYFCGPMGCGDPGRYYPSTTAPSYNSLNNLFSPMLDFPQTPSYFSPAWTGPGNSFSPMGQTWSAPSYQPSLFNGFTDKISKLKQVRKSLVAFFSKKGTLSENHRQRLLSSPFDKA